LPSVVRAVLFGAVGTAGQRCTSIRRLILHKEIYDEALTQLTHAYAHVVVGDPLQEGVLCGPLHSADAVRAFEAAVERAREEGGRVIVGGRRAQRPGFFVEPTVIEVPASGVLPVA